MKNKFKDFIKRHYFFLFIVLISIIRFYIVAPLPLSAYPKQVYDDALMVKLSKSIIEGHWLGAYDNNTLIKGVGFPVFIAILKFLNIPYLFGMNILYILACIYFIYIFKDEFKNKFLRVLIFIIMLFNPISYAEYTFQRVYRNGTGIFQTIFIFSAIYFIWKNRDSNIKNIIPHIILASINVAFLWHSRDDSMWIMPFLIVALGLTSICVLIKYFRNKQNNTFAVSFLKILCILMPIWILIFSTTSIKLLNYMKYGVFIEKETDCNLGKVLSVFYQVKANEKVYRTDNTREKINRMCEVSPTLNSIKPHLDNSLDVWTQFDSNPNDGEVENGWFSWAMEYAVRNAGKYFNPKESNAFYGQIYNEINDALEAGKLERENDVIVSFLPPFHEEYKNDLLKFYLGYFEYISEFREMESSNSPSEESDSLDNVRILDFEFVTGNKTVSRNSTNIRLVGWYFLKNKEDFKLFLTNEKNEKIAEISRMDSTDITNVYSLNPSYNYRFDFVLNDVESISEYKDLYISSYTLNGDYIESIPLNEYIQDAAIENEKSTHSITIASIDKRVDPTATYSEKSIQLLNSIKNIYSKTGKLMLIICLIIYIIISIVSIVKSISTKHITHSFNVFLILTAILLSTMLLTAGVAYTGLTCCYTFMYLYLACAFPLFIMFVCITLGYSIQLTKDIFYK